MPLVPAFGDDTALLGRIALALAAHFPEWVRRRTTTFAFLDEKAYLRRLDVNFRLPSKAWFAHGKGADLAAMVEPERTLLRPGQPPQAAVALPETVYVPLNITPKGTLAAFRIADADDHAVAMRNRLERCRLTVDGFSSLADRYALEHGLRREPGAYRAEIESIVAAPRAQDGAWELRRALRGELGALLDPHDPYRQLLSELAVGFMVLVPVPFEAADHLFNLSHTVRYRWSSGLRSTGQLLSWVFSSLGIAPKSLAFPGHRIGWAQSTHFVVHEPAEAHLLSAALIAEDHMLREPDRRRRRALRARSEREAKPPLHEVFAQPQADVSALLTNPSQPMRDREQQATLTLTLCPRRSGAFGAVTVVAWVSAALLFVISHYLSGIDLQASTTVAVVLPALVAASLVRQGEHAIAGLLLAGVRWCGVIVIVLVFAAAAFLAIRASAPAATTEATCLPAAPAATGQLLPFGDVALAAPRRARTSAPMGFDCSVEDAAPSARPPKREHVIVAVGTIGTGIVALVLSAGMLLTSSRIGRARRRLSRRAGQPVDQWTTGP